MRKVVKQIEEQEEEEDWEVGPETQAKIVSTMTQPPAKQIPKTKAKTRTRKTITRRKIETVPRMTDRKSFPKQCPKCGAGIKDMRKNGTGSNGLKLYKCKKCMKGFYKPSDMRKYRISPRQH